MQRVMLKSKIHRATVTDCDLHYVGSITIDPELLEAADILEHEQVHVVDIDNGARFETYTIAGERGSGDMRVNGAAARLVHRGDTIIVISYGSYDEADLERYEPRVVHVRGRHQPHRHDRRAGGDPAGSSPQPSVNRPSERNHHVQPSNWHTARSAGSDPARPSPTRPASAHDPAPARREEAAGRPDRDGHRLRLPERPRGRGGGRRPGAGGRLRRHDHARLHRHHPGASSRTCSCWPARRGAASRPRC